MRRRPIVLLFLILLPGAALAQEAKPQDLGVLLGQGIQDYQFQAFDQARQKLQAVLAVEPDNPYALHYLGRVEYETNHPQRAVELLEHQIRTGTRFEGDAELLANAYLRAGMLDKALNLAKQLHRSQPDQPSITFLLANVRETRGEYAEALKLYEHLVRNPGYADAARFQRGSIFMRHQAFHKANAEFAAIRKDGSYGQAATQYLDALRPAVQPLSLSATVQYFYNDNPGSASSVQAKGAIPSVTTPSAGSMAMLSLNTTSLDLGLHAHAQLGYSYLSIAHVNREAKANDFAMHMLQLIGTWVFNPNWTLTGVASAQRNLLDRMHLNDTYNGNLTIAYTPGSRRWQAHADLGISLKRHSNAFGRGYAVTDMTYLDADSPSAGFGGAWFFDNGASVQGSYLFQLERTLKNINPVLNQKSRDSYFRQHNLSASGHLPFTGSLSRLSLDASASYYYRSYLYQQSGITLPSIHPGRYLRAIGKSGDLVLNALLWKRWSLSLSAGIHWEQARSDARELSYRQKKYYGQISARF